MTPHLTIRPAPVRRSVEVAVGRERAFEVFTAGMARWWPRDKSIASSPQTDVVLEPRPGGRWYERGEDGSETEWGRVLAWDPPGRLLLAWQIDADWRYDPDLESEVEVLFHELGPKRTRVAVEHRKLEAFGDKAEVMRELFEQPKAWESVVAAYAKAVGE
jgi:uncharacterized protein YndB with AHSA1/START domain